MILNNLFIIFIDLNSTQLGYMYTFSLSKLLILILFRFQLPLGGMSYLFQVWSGEDVSIGWQPRAYPSLVGLEVSLSLLTTKLESKRKDW